MGVLAVTHIIIFLSVFCVDIIMGSPVADPDPGVKVNIDVNVNDGKDSSSGSSGKEESCQKDCGHWCYPSKDWPYTCPNFCAGTSQSPIDICADSANPETGSINFSSTYSDPINKIKIKNNGHSVTMSWDTSLPARTISGGGLTGDYTLAQFHFHWGCKNNRGSEHVVNGTRYAMENHFVHYKTSYGNLSNALKYADGLAVLGVFYDVGAENAQLKPITDSLTEIVNPGSDAWIVFNIALIDLIPSTRTFYRYQGSLTTPTCNEVVTWTVFSEPLSFAENQVKALRMLKDSHDHYLCDNYRGIQPLNGRQVKEFKA